MTFSSSIQLHRVYPIKIRVPATVLRHKIHNSSIRECSIVFYFRCSTEERAQVERAKRLARFASNGYFWDTKRTRVSVSHISVEHL